MAKFRVHYKLVCEGILDIEARDEEEAREDLLSDYLRLYKDSDFDDVNIIEVEEVKD